MLNGTGAKVRIVSNQCKTIFEFEVVCRSACYVSESLLCSLSEEIVCAVMLVALAEIRMLSFSLLNIDEVSCPRLYIVLRQLCTVMFDTSTEDGYPVASAKRNLVFASG